MSVIASVVVVATIGASPAYAVPDRANVTNELSTKESAIGTTTNPQAVTATVAAGTKPVGVTIAPTTQPPKCDLRITKTMSPTTLVSGQPATVTLTVVNVGTGVCPPRLLLGTVLSDNKLSGLTFTGAPVANPPTGWACSLPSGNATCANLATLPPGYTVTFKINSTVTAPPGTGVANCAQIANPFDTNQANNQSCVTKQVSPVSVPGALPPSAR